MITNIPAWPLRSQGKSQAQYSAEVEACLTAMPQAIEDLNAVGSAYALATNATSATSNAIGTGAKTFNTQTNLGYQVGQSLRIANSATNYMTGEVTSYNTGTGALVMNISSVVGTGTFTSWFISQSATGASSAGAVSFTPAGNISASNVQSALAELDTEKAGLALGNTFTGSNVFSNALNAFTGALVTFLDATFRSALVTGAGLLGYGTGSGGSVTQLTSKATSVTLNKAAGQIYLNASSLAASGVVAFTVVNSTVTTNDNVLLTFAGGGTVANYNWWTQAAAGSFSVNIRNISGGALAEALVFNYVVIKGATS